MKKEISMQVVNSQAGGVEQEEQKEIKVKRAAKNQQKFDVPMLSYRFLGMDLFGIDGVSYGTVMTFLSEMGKDIFKFKTAKQFTSWLRLAPNNKISGGKVLSSVPPKVKTN